MKDVTDAISAKQLEWLVSTEPSVGCPCRTNFLLVEKTRLTTMNLKFDNRISKLTDQLNAMKYSHAGVFKKSQNVFL